MVTESFYRGLLDYPHYTRPKKFKNKEVPEILLSGNHENIKKWRIKQSLIRTMIRRPDLLEKVNLTNEELEIIKGIEVKLREEVSDERNH